MKGAPPINHFQPSFPIVRHPGRGRTKEEERRVVP